MTVELNKELLLLREFEDAYRDSIDKRHRARHGFLSIKKQRENDVLARKVTDKLRSLTQHREENV